MRERKRGSKKYQEDQHQSWLYLICPLGADWSDDWERLMIILSAYQHHLAIVFWAEKEETKMMMMIRPVWSSVRRQRSVFHLSSMFFRHRLRHLFRSRRRPSRRLFHLKFSKCSLVSYSRRRQISVSVLSYQICSVFCCRRSEKSKAS